MGGAAPRWGGRRWGGPRSGGPRWGGGPTDSSRLSLLLSACFLAGCFQEVDPGLSAAVRTPDGGHTQSTTTPPIALDPSDPTRTTTRACDRTTEQATAILTDTCASCHGGRAPGEDEGEPPFDYVLNFGRLVTARSAKVADPDKPSCGMHFVVPGEPDRSLLYRMVVSTPPQMPPPTSAAGSALPMPTVSDMSILRTWIEDCLPPAPPDPGDAGAGPGDGSGN